MLSSQKSCKVKQVVKHISHFNLTVSNNTATWGRAHGGATEKSLHMRKAKAKHSNQ